MRNGVDEVEDTTLGLCLFAHVAVLLPHANHDAWLARATHDRGKDGTWGIIAGKTSLHE